MNNDQKQTMAAFIQWLPQNIQQFEGSLPKEVIEPIAAAQSPEEVVTVLNQLSQSQEGNQVVSAIFQAFQESQKAGMFAKGGKLGQLLNKYQIGGALRKRDELNAHRGSYPDRQTMERNYIDMHGTNTENVFSRSTLEHNVVTSGVNGVPRRPNDVITNYDIPSKSGTTYIDANGLKNGRNPGFFRRLFGNFHTPEFINSVDEKLKNANQYNYLKEKY